MPAGGQAGAAPPRAARQMAIALAMVARCALARAAGAIALRAAGASAMAYSLGGVVESGA